MGELAAESRILLEVRDTTIFRQSDPLKLDDWIMNNSYSYETVNPPLPEIEVCTQLQRDLERYFPYTASVEKRVRRAVVLSRKNKIPPTEGLNSPIIDSLSGKLHFKNVRMNLLLNYLKPLTDWYGILIDESESPVIDALTLSWPVSNWKKLVSELKRNGWSLTFQDKQMDMLVIKDKPVGTR
ncbi:MAG: hypothetical protein ABWZ25_11435 [Chitinophagaceae bacterium]